MLSATELLTWLGQHQFLSTAQVDELRPRLPGYPDIHTLAKDLIRRDWITPYQVNQILQGKHDQLVLGSYRLRERLGEGAMGQVFKAMSLRLARIVALKMIHKELVSNSKARDRFSREVKTAAQLNHPNIALVRDSDEADGRLFLVMDYIEGFNLSQRVKQQGPLPIHEAVEYARQAAIGLQHALKCGIVHRDIKPSNLIVTTLKSNNEQSSVVKILDFGLALYDSEEENSTRLTQVGNLLGTIDYIAPEQAQNASTADIRADIYSLGCTLYYMLAGHPPFQGDSVVEKIGPRLTGDPPSIRKIRPEVPVPLDEILRKIMARLPANRFQTPVEVAQALQPFTAKEAIETPVAQFAPAELVMAQPVPADEVNKDGLLMARPVDGDAPFFGSEPSPDEETETAPAQEDEPAFLGMSATGREVSADGATAGPAIRKQEKPFPTVLVVSLAGGGLVLFSLLALVLCMFGSVFGNRDNKEDKVVRAGSLKITRAQFGVPVAKGGEKRRVLVWLSRVDCKGPVKLTLKNLPPEVRSDPITLPANAESGEVYFTVEASLEAEIEAPILVVAEAEGLSAEFPLTLKARPDPLRVKIP